MIIEVRWVTGYPARKLGPLLEGCIAFAEKIGFRDTHLFQCRTHRRPGTFADADRADGIALYQLDPDALPVFRSVARSDNSGCEPSCVASAHDADRSNHMRHSQIPAYNCCQPLFVNQADEEIVAPIRRKRESDSAVQKPARNPTLNLVPLSSADMNWF